MNDRVTSKIKNFNVIELTNKIDEEHAINVFCGHKYLTGPFVDKLAAYEDINSSPDKIRKCIDGDIVIKRRLEYEIEELENEIEELKMSATKLQEIDKPDDLANMIMSILSCETDNEISVSIDNGKYHYNFFKINLEKED